MGIWFVCLDQGAIEGGVRHEDISLHAKWKDLRELHRPFLPFPLLFQCMMVVALKDTKFAVKLTQCLHRCKTKTVAYAVLSIPLRDSISVLLNSFLNADAVPSRSTSSENNPAAHLDQQTLGKSSRRRTSALLRSPSSNTSQLPLKPALLNKSQLRSK